MTKVQRAPGIPNEKSRTVRPVHGPATIYLPLQVYALPCRDASVLSPQYAPGFPASVPDILGLPIATAQWYTPSSIVCIKKHVEIVSSNVRFMTHWNETIDINDLCLSVGVRSDGGCAA
jgi:hypothetical protein